MAYNINLAKRVSSMLKGTPVIEKKMFGGVGYMLNGNTPALHQTQCGASVACGILGDDLIVRVKLEDYEKLLKRAHVKIFTMKNGPRPMKGWLMVEPAGYKTAKQLADWVKMGVEFAASLPPK